MFRQLRNRFLLINMTIISLMMIAAFAVIYITTYSAVQIENQNKLSSLTVPIKVTGSFEPYGEATAKVTEALSIRMEGDATQEIEAYVARLPADFALSFSVMLNAEGEVAEINSVLDMPKDTYYSAASLADSQDYMVITVDNRKWMYKKAFITTTSMRHETMALEEQAAEGAGYIISTSRTTAAGFTTAPGTTAAMQQITFMDVTETSRTLSRLLMTFLLVGTLMLFVIFGISLYFANRAIAPLALAWDKQKQFVADASHELKTPLAIINANIDALLSNQEQPIISQRRWLDYIQAQTERMSTLVSDLLYLAKAEDTETSRQHLPVDLSQIVCEALLAMEAVVFEKGFAFDEDVEAGIIVPGDAEKIKQAVLILLDNAVKYTPSHGDISVSLKRNRNQAVFSLRNSGEGIAKEELARIFDRFYRGDPARTQASGGYGLGLSIAKASIENMGGRIYADSVAGESTTFSFTLGI